MARHLATQARALVQQGTAALERFAYLDDEEVKEEAQQVFDGITLQEILRVLERYKSWYQRACKRLVGGLCLVLTGLHESED